MAPVNGWIVRDSLEVMDPQSALLMTNWFPRQQDVVARNGYVHHCDLGTDEIVRAVLPYHNGDTKKLFAVSGGKLWDATTSTPVSLVSGLSGTDFVSATLRNHMIIVNGVDQPLLWNGSAFVSHTFEAAPGFTLDTSNLNYVFAYKGRLFFVEKGTQSIWYGALHAIGGELQKFDLSLVQSLDGEAMILTGLTVDGGEGPDDLFIIITTDGDVISYSGSEPGVAANWNKVGTYKIGAPLSRRAHVVSGADIIISTMRGYESLARSTREGEGVRLRQLLSDAIQPEVSKRARVRSRQDWDIMLYPRGRMMIFQVPVTDDLTLHHVRNIDSGRWTTFDLPAAYSWAVLDQLAYMGGRDGRVFLFDEGETDDGEPIELVAETAWNALGAHNALKQLHFTRISLTGIYFPNIDVSLATDFERHRRITGVEIAPQSPPAYWDQSHFGEAYFSHGLTTNHYQHKHNASGRVFSIQVKCVGHIGGLSWNTTTFFVETGGPA